MRVTTVAIVGGTALLSMLIPGCRPRTPKVIKIGTIQSTSGQFSSFGQGGLFGVQAAVDDLNRQGGVKVGDRRVPIQLVAVNNASDPNMCMSLAENLIVREDVQFLVSGIAPPPMHAGISQMADRYKVPYVASVGPLEPWMGMKSETTSGWSYSWAVGGFSINAPEKAGDPQGLRPGYSVMDTWTRMLDQYGSQTNRKVGLICTDDPDGRAWYTLFGPALVKRGYTVVGLDRKLGLLAPDTSDFSPVIKVWKHEGVDILWGNAPGAFFGSAWKQAKGMGFRPKMVSLGRGAVCYADVNAWGGDLALGVGTEVWWDPSIQGAVGIGDTTPQSLADRWVAETRQPIYPSIGPGYASVQVLANAIERAGSTDREQVNQALASTDMRSIQHRVKFDANHFSQEPLAFGQWFKTNRPEKWELKVTYSSHDFWPMAAKPIFPLP